MKKIYIIYFTLLTNLLLYFKLIKFKDILSQFIIIIADDIIYERSLIFKYLNRGFI